MLKVMMSAPRLFRMGYYQVSTGSRRNYETILGTLEALPVDRLSGIPFKLRLVEEATTYRDNDGKRKKGKKWFLQLEPDPAYIRSRYARMVGEVIELGAPQPGTLTPIEEFDAVEPAAPPPIAQDQRPDEPATSETPAPPEAAPSAEPRTLTEAEALELFTWTRNSLVVTDKFTLAALGVQKASDFVGDLIAARERVTQRIAHEQAMGTAMGERPGRWEGINGQNEEVKADERAG
jgi:hypothetical protein